MTVAVLFAHQKSIYKTFRGVDVWDETRDARLWPGGCPAVMHPPCRAWGRFSHFAKPEPHERQLAIDAIWWARRDGGVVEHPAHSKLWKHLKLPIGGETDEWGGFTLHVDQVWWVHPCKKATFLYVCGIRRTEVPPIPAGFVNPTHVVESSRTRRRHGEKMLPYLPKSGRMHTPEAFALWLVELASRCAAGST